jgi:tetratricopeptide (TPR) repeat protein
MAYSNRGVAYGNVGDHMRAIRDLDRAIELNPQDAIAYGNRGLAYRNLGNINQSTEDFKVAARLGLKWFQDYLRERGITW